MIYSDGKALFIVTDNRKSVYEDLITHPFAELSSYNLYTRMWIRVSGRTQEENSRDIREAILDLYPMIRQEYTNQDEIFFVIFRLTIETAAVK
ncbi:MAG: hypothetical protein K2P71_05705 [Lachnospiraceae bacterium]|nr:hypothetical protein [Lachnospiraceae bacterium]